MRYSLAQGCRQCPRFVPSFPRKPRVYFQTFAQHFHAITHSFAQRRYTNPLIINRLRILSIATGVVLPFTLSGFREGSNSPALGRSDVPGSCCKMEPLTLGTKP
jgi:hypothetical protein